MNTYKMEPHSMTKVIAGKKYCAHCGLVALNNDFTRWAIRMGCNNSSHPDHEKQRLKSGGLP